MGELLGQNSTSNEDTFFDSLLMEIADYVRDYPLKDEDCFDLARYSLMDSIGCAMLALKFPECIKQLGPISPGTSVPNGARVVGTYFELDPVKASFDMGCLISWLSFNDYNLQGRPIHPSENIGAILAIADYVSRQRMSNGYEPLVVRDMLAAIIKAYEIQHWLNINHTIVEQVSFQDFVKISCAAVVTHLIGGDKTEIMHAVSQAFLDGVALKTENLAQTQSTRCVWSAADATSRAVRLALMTMTGEAAVPTVLSMRDNGFYQVFCNGREFSHDFSLGETAIENTIYNLYFPGGYHFCSAVESAFMLHNKVQHKLELIERIEILTYQAAVEHFSTHQNIQRADIGVYKFTQIIACVLLNGVVDLEQFVVLKDCDKRVNELSKLIEINEQENYTRAYLNRKEQLISCGIKLHFNDGTHSDLVETSYPLGHRSRRAEGLNRLQAKFEKNIQSRFPKGHAQEIIDVCRDKEAFETMAVNEFVDLLVI